MTPDDHDRDAEAERRYAEPAVGIVDDLRREAGEHAEYARQASLDPDAA
ncbi:MAG: hypothetical protein ACRC33_31010 [Gemmataceae bacterium]